MEGLTRSEMGLINFMKFIHFDYNMMFCIFIMHECSVMSSGEDDAVARAAVAKGLCYFLEEPIKPDDLICVMQQVYGPQKKPANMYPNECFTKELQELEEKEKEKQNSTQHRREVRSKKRKKRQRVRSKVAEHNNGESSNKKPRFVWTPDLHHKFVQAVLVLGDQSSTVFFL